MINIVSIDGQNPTPQETYSYQASKSGLMFLTRRMAGHLAPEHIIVTAIAPGHFPSDMNAAARERSDEYAALIPARRVGTDEDMAGAAIYLASRAGDYVVGSTLTVDGGLAIAGVRPI
ncbi:SDR family oxidoreductase [Phenylobacterium sp.]|uniref:SDR family oxidoreductase n=1 Tax=Phenylobacterium sp. TaxID=1871053 RepID=UPI002732D322|nr:SDR family oxidoreductase [Phenylobacterium sp.]MDP3660490.1 SDR family oxidoreductase [Phenylobacterium sp.]